MKSFQCRYPPYQELAILPPQLQAFRPEDSGRAPSWPEAWLYAGYTVVPDSTGDFGRYLEVRQGDGGMIRSRYVLRRFRSRADGRFYRLILPNIQVLTGTPVTDIYPADAE